MTLDGEAPRTRRELSFNDGNHSTFRFSRVVVGALVLVALWEAAALWFTRNVAHPEYVMPDLVYVVRHGLPGLSDYYTGVFGGTPPADGGSRTWYFGLLALVEQGLVSALRVMLGLMIGTAVGVTAGLVTSAVAPVRHATSGPTNLLRMLPILALGPLFTLWFGPHTLASVIFIAFAVALTMMVATSQAVGNIDADVVHYAATLGVGTLQTYRAVVLPAVVPEIAASLTLCGPLAWSVLLASEIYGIQDGLGWMMGQALSFTLVDRITVIAAAFIVVNFLTLRAMQVVVRRLTRWVE